MSKYIDADRLQANIKEIENKLEIGNYYLDNSEQAIGYYNALMDFERLILSLQQEQPKVDLEKTIEFECIGKKVKMTVQELINYYIDTECCDVADECGF